MSFKICSNGIFAKQKEVGVFRIVLPPSMAHISNKLPPLSLTQFRDLDPVRRQLS